MQAVVRPKDQKIIHINGYGHGGLFSRRYEYHPIPDQDIPADWWDEDRLVAELTWPDDLVQYASEELAKTPGAALAALKARGPAQHETMPGLSERVGLIERILRLE